MDILSSILIGILSSLVASFTFLFFLTRLRPRVVISDSIAKVKDLEAMSRVEADKIEEAKNKVEADKIEEAIAKIKDDTKKAPIFIYKIKIVNKTWWPIINIKTQLQWIKTENVKGGVSIYGLSDLSFAGDDPLEISGSWRMVNENFAYRFRIREDLDTLYDNDRSGYLRFSLFASHSLSGFGRVFPQEYHVKGDLKEGDFEFGKGLEIRS